MLSSVTWARGKKQLHAMMVTDDTPSSCRHPNTADGSSVRPNSITMNFVDLGYLPDRPAALQCEQCRLYSSCELIIAVLHATLFSASLSNPSYAITSNDSARVGRTLWHHGSQPGLSEHIHATRQVQGTNPGPGDPSDPINGPGNGCIAVHQTVLVQGRGATAISALTAGDMVRTSDGYQPYIGSMHNPGVEATLVLTIATGRSVELTPDHLIKTEAGFVRAATVNVGTNVATVNEDGKEAMRPVLHIASGSSQVAAPLTRSGTVIVHGVVLSCHAAILSHAVANAVLVPVRLGMVSDMHAYIRGLVGLYDRLPQFAKMQLMPNGHLLL